jgi:hypothetical protein
MLIYNYYLCHGALLFSCEFLSNFILFPTSGCWNATPHVKQWYVL